MEQRNHDEPHSSIRKRIKRQKSNIENKDNQQHDNIITDTFAIEEKDIKYEKKEINQSFVCLLAYYQDQKDV